MRKRVLGPLFIFLFFWLVCGPPATAQTLVADPGAVTMSYLPGSPPPQPLTIAITSSAGAPANVTATVTSNPAGLFVIAAAGSSVSLGVDPRILGQIINLPLPQTLSGEITVNAPGYTAISIPLTLLAGATAPLTVDPSSLSLDLSAEGPFAIGTIAVDNPDLPVNFVASVSAGASWLSLEPSAGVTPATITVKADPTGLPEGTYTASVRISGGGTNADVTVTFVVSTLTIHPAVLSYSYQTGTSVLPPVQTAVVYPGDPYAFVTTATNNGGPWLFASALNSDSPPRFTVSVSPVGLAPGEYSGNVYVTSGVITRSIPVRLTVTLSPVVVTNPGTVVAVFPNNTAPASLHTVSITSSDSPHSELSFAAAASVPWLEVNPKSGTTASLAGVSVNPSGMPPGLYTGSVSITTAEAGSPHVVPVVMSIAPSDTVQGLTVQPAILSFEANAGSQAPVAQSLSVLAPGPAQFFAYAVSEGNWLSISAAGGTTPGSLSVSVNPASLVPGTYAGTVTVYTAQESLQVQVTFTVAATGPDMVLSSTFASFDYKPGDPVPAARQVQVVGPAGVAFTASALATGGTGAWLTVSPLSGTAPATLAIGVNPASLVPGTYSGSITVASTGGYPQTVFVSLVVQEPGAIAVTPTALSFSCVYGGPPPTTRTLLVSSNVAEAIRFAAFPESNGWLSVTPNGSTPATLRVSVEPGALLPGSYRGTITLSAEETNSSSQVVSVLLSISEPLPTVTGLVNAASGLPGPVAPGMVVSIAGRAFAPAVPLTAVADENGTVALQPGRRARVFQRPAGARSLHAGRPGSSHRPLRHRRPDGELRPGGIPDDEVQRLPSECSAGVPRPVLEREPGCGAAAVERRPVAKLCRQSRREGWAHRLLRDRGRRDVPRRQGWPRKPRLIGRARGVITHPGAAHSGLHRWPTGRSGVRGCRPRPGGRHYAGEGKGAGRHPFRQRSAEFESRKRRFASGHGGGAVTFWSIGFS